MNEKQKRFAVVYLKDFNGTRAYKEVYNCSDEVARRSASRLLTNVDIQKLIQEESKKQLEKAEVSVVDIINELKAIAFSKGSDYAKVTNRERNVGTKENPIMVECSDVDIIDTDKLTEDQKKAISCIKQTRYGINIETYDKTKALELLGKYMNIFSENINLNDNSKSTSLLESINNQLKSK